MVTVVMSVMLRTKVVIVMVMKANGGDNGDRHGIGDGGSSCGGDNNDDDNGVSSSNVNGSDGRDDESSNSVGVGSNVKVVVVAIWLCFSVTIHHKNVFNYTDIGGTRIMLGNGVVGILAESVNKWERRAPLTPSHCARLLHGGTGVSRIIVQPSTKRIHHDALYEEVGAEISQDLSQCGLILGIKQPKLEMILPDRAYAFFSHTHKAQKENMPLLDKILAERASLYDYELIVGDNGKRLLAFGKFAGRAGMIDFLRGLGQRFLSLGYSTPFLSLGSSYMYPSLAAAKAAVISVGEEIATQGLPLGICPLVFVFTGSGNVCSGAQEIFKLLPHTFVDPSKLRDLHRTDKDQPRHASKRVFQVYGCVVTAQDMVEPKDHVIVFDKTVEGIPNVTGVQLDVMDHANLCKYIAQVNVVISLLPPSCHIIVANACIELKKHLVTASYVDSSMSMLNDKAKDAGITILGEMGLDPGIDHMMAMKMINQAHVRKGKIKSFTSYCGGLPSPEAANNPLAYKFSWNPAGAIRAGRNPATYKWGGETVHIDGNDLYDSATRLRLPDLPAFALECLPNRNSLLLRDLYGITEASTIFRGTLRYEGMLYICFYCFSGKHFDIGFSEIMGTLSRIGLFNNEAHSLLMNEQRQTFRKFLFELLKVVSDNPDGPLIGENDIMEHILTQGHCKDQRTAMKTAKTIIFLGLLGETEIPASCKSAFDVVCFRMEERLSYTSTEKDMVLLHHELEIEYPDSQITEKHRATLLEFGKTLNGKTTTAMALTVGIPAAVGALLLLTNKIQTRGVLRPIEPEVYTPALDIIEAYGIKLIETTE
ncbi:Alpha-aminoadipic semialdehyde synthase [Glycine soja]|uniref:Alpha-aminoadipic semialdehyde synthase n=1 Tax=Glycine soja TaxID=3848 RepID=A0A445HEL4_GLYSO|nr:Alpha-aminoadipic semialdehyde synthase [Glycine soja]